MADIRRMLTDAVARGPIRVTTLTMQVARQSRTDVEKVTATVWELVSEGVLDYRTDAHVTARAAQEEQITADQWETDPARRASGGPGVSSDDKGAYEIDNGEYVPRGSSPHNPDFDDPVRCAELLAETKQSITGQPVTAQEDV